MFIETKFLHFDTETSMLFFDEAKYLNSSLNRMADAIKENLDSRRKRCFDNKVITTLNITPSMHCDGRCLYCYNEESNNTIKDNLTLTTVIDSIMKLELLGYEIKPTTIRMYGGEPLQCKELHKILEYLQLRYEGVIFYISSGLFISEEDFRYFVSTFKDINNLSIGIGVDLGTYPETRVGNINKAELLARAVTLYDNGYNIIFVNTVTKYTKAEALFSEIETWTTRCPDAKFRVAVACDATTTPTEKDIQDIYELMDKRYSANKNITANVFPYLDVIYAPDIYCLNDDTFYLSYAPTYCGIYRDMINILPDGTFTRCHMNIEDKNMKIDSFKCKEELIDPTDCKDCCMYLVCRGGCFYRKRIADTYITTSGTNIYCSWIYKSFVLALSRLANLYSDENELKKELKKMSCQNQN